MVDELKTKLGRQNIELQVQSLGMVQLREVIDSKTYELLLYGFDFSRDRDPYLFWHSSQVERLNFAGYADRDSDIFLEDARGITDRATRDAKYNEFYEKLANEFVVIYYDPLSYVYVTDSKIKNIKPITGYEAASRYSQVNEWYIKERRTRK
ncbi:MAG: Oligopeptide-binding protein AppA precursor [bacterium ADurb.Bin400]|nr:MAG: Oligopeptide-binding protein AppA precursor [bacterium ADurb.Bin400]